MTVSRKYFLQSAATLGCGILLSSLSKGLTGCNSTARAISGNKPYGLQLYTLRDDLAKDPKGVLKQVSGFGYKHIESFEGDKGMFWGMKNTEFKKYMDDLDMRMVASHCNIDQNFDRKVAEAAEIGMAYLIAPWLGPQKTIDDYKRAAEKYNQRGETCRKAGLRFAYHNHDYTFMPVNGIFPQDVLMQNTDAKLVDYEMDIYWVVTAGQDPAEWFRRYPGRFILAHLKDRKKGVPLSDKDASTVLGTGSIDWPSVLKVAEASGLKYFIAEQERYDGTTPLESTKLNAAYMKSLKV
jgi:sugar phosphate isomerase/epimerase